MFVWLKSLALIPVIERPASRIALWLLFVNVIVLVSGAPPRLVVPNEVLEASG